MSPDKLSPLRREGWFQTAIAKELGLPRETVRDWLKNGHPQIGEVRQLAENGENRLFTKLRYNVANCRLEHFQPPAGVTFPLIIADLPWNVSDPGRQRERTGVPRCDFWKTSYSSH